MSKHSLRVGLELELLAPSGRTRFDFAQAVARQVKGRVEYRLHYHGEGHLPSGLPNCVLTRGARVLDANDTWLIDVVDDITIDVPGSREKTWLGRIDDVRLALLAESVSASESPNPMKLLRHFTQRLRGSWADETLLVDRVGHTLLKLEETPVSRLRVCEVVTRPLKGPERNEVVTLLLATAKRLAFQIPRAAAMHAHYDAKPFATTARLQSLILEFSAQRQAIWQLLEPNRHCKRLGPFNDLVQRVARETDPTQVSFSTFATALQMAGATKYCDLNILGAIERFPRHPTVELRCLPVDFSAQATLDRLDAADEILRRCAHLPSRLR